MKSMAKKPMVNLARLEEVMAEKGWGAGELAAYSGVKYDTIYSLKKGRRLNPGAETLKKIAEALGVSVDYLLGESEDRQPQIEKPPMPEAIRRLSEVANRLSDVRQEELIRIAEALAKLEREQPLHTLPTRAMEVLLEAAGELGIEEEILDELENLLRSNPPTRLIDLGSGELTGDLPQSK
jgi:Predicted transcriptional regulators